MIKYLVVALVVLGILFGGYWLVDRHHKQQLQDRDQRIQALGAQVQAKDAEVQSLKGQLSERIARASDLETRAKTKVERAREIIEEPTKVSTDYVGPDPCAELKSSCTEALDSLQETLRAKDLALDKAQEVIGAQDQEVQTLKQEVVEDAAQGQQLKVELDTQIARKKRWRLGACGLGVVVAILLL